MEFPTTTRDPLDSDIDVEVQCMECGTIRVISQPICGAEDVGFFAMRMICGTCSGSPPISRLHKPIKDHRRKKCDTTRIPVAHRRGERQQENNNRGLQEYTTLSDDGTFQPDTLRADSPNRADVTKTPLSADDPPSDNTYGHVEPSGSSSAQKSPTAKRKATSRAFADRPPKRQRTSGAKEPRQRLDDVWLPQESVFVLRLFESRSALGLNEVDITSRLNQLFPTTVRSYRSIASHEKWLRGKGVSADILEAGLRQMYSQLRRLHRNDADEDDMDASPTRGGKVDKTQIEAAQEAPFAASGFEPSGSRGLGFLGSDRPFVDTMQTFIEQLPSKGGSLDNSRRNTPRLLSASFTDYATDEEDNQLSSAPDREVPEGQHLGLDWATQPAPENSSASDHHVVRNGGHSKNEMSWARGPESNNPNETSVQVCASQCKHVTVDPQPTFERSTGIYVIRQFRCTRCEREAGETACPRRTWKAIDGRPQQHMNTLIRKYHKQNALQLAEDTNV